VDSLRGRFLSFGIERVYSFEPSEGGDGKEFEGVRFYPWAGHSIVIGKQRRGWKGRVLDLQILLSKISKEEEVEEGEARGGDWRRLVVGARKVLCQLAVRRMGYSGAAVAWFFGVTTSLVNRHASSEKAGNLDQYL